MWGCVGWLSEMGLGWVWSKAMYHCLVYMYAYTHGCTCVYWNAFSKRIIMLVTENSTGNREQVYLQRKTKIASEAGVRCEDVINIV